MTVEVRMDSRIGEKDEKDEDDTEQTAPGFGMVINFDLDIIQKALSSWNRAKRFELSKAGQKCNQIKSLSGYEEPHAARRMALCRKRCKDGPRGQEETNGELYWEV